MYVNRSCLRLPVFRPAGVSVVCPVAKSSVSPLPLEEPQGNRENNAQIATLPPAEPEMRLVERRAVGESNTFVIGAGANRPDMLQLKQIIRTEMQEALRDVGLHGPQGIGALSAPVGQPVARAFARSRHDEMHSCIRQLPRIQASVAASVAGLPEIGLTVFKKHVKRQLGMFVGNGGEAGPFGSTRPGD